MKKLFSIIAAVLLLIGCDQKKSDIVLIPSTGRINKVLVVTKSSNWQGKIGDNIRSVFGEHVLGLPQPETILSVSQVAPKGFQSIMKRSRRILVLSDTAKEEKFTKTKNKYSQPQTIVYLSSTSKEGLLKQLQKHGKEIINIFRNEDLKFMQSVFHAKKIDDSKFKTLQTLGISLTIPNDFRLVENSDTGDFLWLRHRLKSGIAKGDGSNNILVYSVPLTDENTVADNITAVRDTIGKMHIPGSKEGMYMITEAAYTPSTFETKVAGKKAYETRGKWEVKNDFMAGPFLNYTIIDKKNNRLIVIEGFTYAPSVNKRDFVFELEAIAKSVKFK